jgi:hypothetical protein
VVGPVPARDRGPTGKVQATDQRDRTRLPDPHEVGHIEVQYIDEVGVHVARVFDEDGDEVAPRVGGAEKRAQQLPEPDEQRFVVVAVLVCATFSISPGKGIRG